MMTTGVVMSPPIRGMLVKAAGSKLWSQRGVTICSMLTLITRVGASEVIGIVHSRFS
jgi:hypothetical protein